ncbi:MAG TPA: hypothetical protein VEZ48_08970 [Sphingomonadaceae bacterium]|nr:hypothetical protein [Sphingomonadaceae bacterium]
MSSLAPLISRFDPIYGDTRYRVPPPLRSRVAAAQASAADAIPPAANDDAPRRDDLRQFLIAFAGGLVFFSILIF